MKTLFVRKLLDLCLFYIVDCFDKDDKDIKDAVICIRNAISYLFNYDLK